MVRTPYFLVSIQRPPIYFFRFAQLALISVKVTQVINSREGGYIIRALCFLVSIQRPPIYLFRFA